MPTKKILFLLSALTAMLGITNCRAVAPQQAVIKLNPQEKFQIITGWEATAETGQNDSPAWQNYKNELFDLSVNDLGVNRVRVGIKSSIENPVDYYAQWRTGQITEKQFKDKRYEIINDNSDPNTINPGGFQWSFVDNAVDEIVLPLRQRLQARGESLWVNVNYTDFGSSDFEHKSNPQEYAEFVLATYKHFQSKYGFVPDSWEIMLEPDTDTGNWSPAEVVQAIKAAGDLLTANNFKPNFVAPSTTRAANTPRYIEQIAQTPGAMQYVTEFSYHRYDEPQEETIRKIQELARKYGKQTAMLEWIGADYKTLHQDLKIGQNSVWQEYTLAYPNEPDNGAQYYRVNDADVNKPIITAAHRTKFLRQYFRHIRTGAQRIGAETTNAEADPLAFINKNGKYVLIIKSETAGEFSVEGLPPGTYGIGYTTDNQEDAGLPDVALKAAETLQAKIPSAGVLVVYAK